MTNRLDKFLLVNVFVALVISCLLMLPIASAQSESAAANIQAANNVNTVKSQTNNINLEVLVNTSTLYEVQVNNYLITETISPDHTAADVALKNLTTGDITITNYKVTKSGNNYTLGIYMNGTLINTMKTTFDPLAAGAMGTLIKQNQNSAASNTISPMMAGTTFNYDGLVYYHGLYDHPDYNTYGPRYGDYSWVNFNLYGNQLAVDHISQQEAQSIVDAGIPGGIAILAAIIVATGGAALIVGVISAILIAILLVSGFVILFDEDNSMWIWISYSMEYKFIWEVLGYDWVPSYFRLGSYTVWNDIGISDP
jgi:competence protein ComGC